MPIQDLRRELLGSSEGFAALVAERLRPRWFFGYEDQVWFQWAGSIWVSRETQPTELAEACVQVGDEILAYVQAQEEQEAQEAQQEAQEAQQEAQEAQQEAQALAEYDEEAPEGLQDGPRGAIRQEVPGAAARKRLRAWASRGYDVGFQRTIEGRVRQILLRRQEQCNLERSGVNARNCFVRLKEPTLFRGVWDLAFEIDRHPRPAAEVRPLLRDHDAEIYPQREVTREYYLTQRLGCSIWEDGLKLPDDHEIDWESKMPVFWRFMQRISIEDPYWIKSIRQALAYSLLPYTGERTIFICHGPGANGKTVLLALAQRIAGDYSRAIDSAALLGIRSNETTYALSQMRGVRLAVASETDLTDHIPEARIKSLTGNGDVITARVPYGKPFQFTPEFKLWIMTNHKPGLTTSSDSIVSRIKIIPFRAVIPKSEQDFRLLERFEPELPYIASWLLRGWLECLRANGGKIEWAPSILKHTSDYIEEQDLLLGWFESCCTWDLTSRTSSADLYRSWKAWCYEQGHHPGSHRTFALRWQEWGKSNIQEKVKVNGAAWYWGVRLLGPDYLGRPAPDGEMPY